MDLLYVSNNIPNDVYSYLLLSTYYLLSTLLHFSHAFFHLIHKNLCHLGIGSTVLQIRKRRSVTCPISHSQIIHS